MRVQVSPAALLTEKKPKIIAIVGPTASGKTALSLALAERFRGQIISADSRQVYRGLDIGSGKVTQKEMAGIPHHLLDVADVSTIYTAQDFVHDAQSAVAQIVAQGALPIVVGGTFLYLDMLFGKASAPHVPPNPTLRAQLETESLAHLYDRLKVLDPARAALIDKANPRRLIRAIEIATALGHVPVTKPEERYNVLTIGLTIPKEALHTAIETRLHTRLAEGMVAEVEGLLESGVDPKRLEALGLEYRYITRYLLGQLSYEALCRELATKIKQFAKRQLTWLKRDTSILWYKPTEREAIFSTVQAFLAD